MRTHTKNTQLILTAVTNDISSKWNLKKITVGLIYFLSQREDSIKIMD